MNFLKLLAENEKLKVMVTVRDLTEKRWSTVLNPPLQKLGIDRKISLCRIISSFIIIRAQSEKELWYHDVALIECVRDDFRVFFTLIV